MAEKPLFKNKTWLLTWANDRNTEIRISKRHAPIPTTGDNAYALRYPHNGKIVYDYPGTVPEYIKKKVKDLFDHETGKSCGCRSR